MVKAIKNTRAKSARKNCAMPRAAARQENMRSSPVSKKITYKNKFVAEISKLFWCPEVGGSKEPNCIKGTSNDCDEAPGR